MPQNRTKRLTLLSWGCCVVVAQQQPAHEYAFDAALGSALGAWMRDRYKRDRGAAREAAPHRFSTRAHARLARARADTERDASHSTAHDDRRARVARRRARARRPRARRRRADPRRRLRAATRPRRCATSRGTRATSASRPTRGPRARARRAPRARDLMPEPSRAAPDRGGTPSGGCGTRRAPARADVDARAVRDARARRLAVRRGARAEHARAPRVNPNHYAVAGREALLSWCAPVAPAPCARGRSLSLSL